MIISVHQPHYLPWLGYFDKIDQSDIFVILDNVQYKKREFQNRNKILTPGGPQWLTVPVVNKGRYFQTISEVEIDNSINWRKKHLSTIIQSYSKAPYFDKYYPFLQEVYIYSSWKYLMDLNVSMMHDFLDFLGIRVKMCYESELDIDGQKTERIVSICKSLNEKTYLSGSGGKAYMDESRFQEEGLKLRYHMFKHPEYPQTEESFVPYLSILDLLMNCGERSIEVIRRERREIEYSGNRTAS